MKNEVTLKSARKDNDETGIERVNHARIKPTGLKSCWYDACPGLFAKCSDNTTTDDNERRKRFGWDLSNCFQKESGRHPFPSCHTKSPMKNCLEKLDNNAIHTYRQFFLETNSICHQLQYNYFRHQTEKLVNQLVISANYAEEKLDTIKENSEHLLQDSKDIHDSLTKTDRETQEVARTSKNVSNQVNGVLKQSELVFEQSVKIATSQSKMQKGQETVKINLEEGMTMIHEYHNNLRMGIHNLQNETGEIEKTINKVGDVNLLNRDSPK